MTQDRNYTFVKTLRGVLVATMMLLTSSTAMADGVVVKGSVFGGGNQADVKINATVNISAGQVEGNVYGGGKIGDVGTHEQIPNDNIGNYTWSNQDGGSNTTANTDNKNTGVCKVEITGGLIGFEGDASSDDDHGNVFGGGKGDNTTFWCEKAMVYSTNVTIDGHAIVKGSIFGGGEIGRVETDAVVQIGVGEGVAPGGVPTSAPEIKGSVFGAGKGLITHGYSALVRGNVTLTIEGNAKVHGSVYGGGELASVGRHKVKTKNDPLTPPDAPADLPIGMPYTLDGTNVGECTVNVQGYAEIINNVFGAGQGVGAEAYVYDSTFKRMGMDDWESLSEDAYLTFLQTLALATDTDVDISGHAKVNGSVYGGSENGFVQFGTDVSILGNCEIGVSGTTTEGNVYGGGRGISGNTIAGPVSGNTTVTIGGGTTWGSVFGGGAYGVVKENVAVNVTGGEVKKDVYGGGALAHTNTANWTGSALVATYPYHEVIGLTVGSSNVTGLYTKDGSTYTAATGTAAASTTYYRLTNTKVSLTGGTIVGAAYGGGLGDSDTPAYVYGDVLVDLNGTTTMSNGKATTNGTITENNTGCIVNQVFGCNNVNGTPKGDVMVHVFGTQHKDKNAIDQKYDVPEPQGETESQKTYLQRLIDATKLGDGYITGVTPSVITAAQTTCSSSSATNEQLKAAITNVLSEIDVMYDVKAVYGGGNNAAYVPATAYTESATTGSKAQVVIEGCNFTSIQYVYGGGNAAPVPDTYVMVKGTKIIDYVFGGGNGTVKAADVGYDGNGNNQGNGNANTTLIAGSIHNVYGASNTNGDIRGDAIITKTDKVNTDTGCCDNLVVNKMYAAGKDADISGGSKTILGCMPEDKIDEYYGGAENANVLGDVELTITSGKFGKVFGGNKTSGAIFGHIILNIEETGCRPIEIDELYGCGNNAPYSIYGFYDTGNTNPNNGKKIFAVRESATDTHTPVHTDGTPYTSEETFTAYASPVVNIISATSIGKVFGGGYGVGATVYGNPTVNVNMIPGKHATDGHKLGTVGDVYGGGNQAVVYGKTTVNVGTAATVTMISVDGNPNVEGACIIGNVYGGGNQANIEGNTEVNVGTGTYTGEGYEGVSISCLADDELNTGMVFGGGNAADVTGNTVVNMAGGYVENRVYGGGNLGNVGNITERETPTGHSHTETCIQKPKTWAANTGKCTVTVSGGQVGRTRMTMPQDFGYVFGAGRGETKDPAEDPDIEFRAYVDYTEVIIKNLYADGHEGDVNYIISKPLICGGVYGGSENGRVRHDTYVKIQGGQIGCGAEKTAAYAENLFIDPATATVAQINASASAMTECASWTYNKDTALPYDAHASEPGYNENTYGKASTTGSDGHTFYGNVFGGGSGYWSYQKEDGSYEWLPSAGLVEGDTHVTISGGHILTSVYGGNEMTNVGGTCYVTMTGGTLGVPRTLTDIAAHPVTCYLFGAGKGDQRIHFNQSTNVGAVNVSISGGIIYGSVFGGGEDGHVLGDVTMDVSGGTIGTWGTSYVEGNIFGAGRGFGGDALTAGVVCGNVTMTISGGNMLGSIYGGGRLGSVGTHLVPPTGDDRYGKLIDDGKDQVIGESADVTAAGKTHGHITITISGGTIGNSHEYTFPSGITTDDAMATWKGTNHIPNTDFEYDANRGYYMLKHTKGGNVFAGSMGRLYALDGNTPLEHWAELGKAKSTKLTITGGTIKSNVYGGGELGKIEGYRTIKDSQEEDYNASTEVIINQTGTSAIGTEITDGSNVKYTFGSVYGGGYGSTVETFISEAQESGSSSESDVPRPKTHAGIVIHNTKVSMQGGKVLASVYGGGEVASVAGNTDVAVSGGFIGKDKVGSGNSAVYYGGLLMGNVYGGGKGEKNIVRSGQIKGNTYVKISDSPVIYHNIYGGGAYGSVGDFTYTKAYDETFKAWKVTGISSCAAKTGKAEVNIIGGTIGIDGHENGMIFGSSRGDIGAPGEIHDKLAWVYDTEVTVNDGQINGSVYGGGENGHVYHDAAVNVHGGTIGILQDPEYAYRGNVYGGGCGTDKYYTNTTGVANLHDGNGNKYNPLAGIVQGDATVIIDGGHVVHNVYGAGAMGSVGTITNFDDLDDDTKNYKHDAETTDEHKSLYNFGLSWPYEFTYGNTGLTKVTIEGNAIIGVSGSTGGHVYGAARGAVSVGETDITKQRYEEAKLANVRETQVVIGTEGGTSTTTTPEIYGSVYGGGEDGHVNENASVTIHHGTIAHSVFGGGKGTSTFKTTLLDATPGSNQGQNKKDPDDPTKDLVEDVHSWTAGRVYGNTTITMNGGSVGYSIYGGGNMASVGKGNYAGGSDDYSTVGYGELPPSNAQALWSNSNFTGSGLATVNIYDGIVGAANTTYEDGLMPTGNVFGSSRGVAALSCNYSPRYKYVPDFFLGYVNQTAVTIGGTTGDGPTIYGSVYGGGENGHVRRGTLVTINKGTIGVENDETAYKLDRGNVYGAGSGVGKNTENSYNSSSGSVTCETTVTVNGGTIYQNVYGGGAQGSVGPPPGETDETKVATDTKKSYTYTQVNINGGNIGTSNEAGYGGNVYGASRGNASLNAAVYATDVWSTVNINQTSDNVPTRIYGRVFGGGESGIVKCGVDVNVTGGSIAKDVYGGGALANTQTSNWDATNDTWAYTTEKSAKYTTTVRLTGGTVGEKVFGGALGDSDNPAYVYGDVLVDLNGTTTMDATTGKPTTTGTTTTNTTGCIVNQVFGCNNINGTPKGDVMVHVYATQNKDKTTIAEKFRYEDESLEKLDITDNTKETDEDYIARLKAVLADKIEVAEALGLTVSNDDKTLSTSSSATADALKTAITGLATNINTKTTDEINAVRFDVKAVYGGGNQAAYNPVSPNTSTTSTPNGAQTRVIIEGCSETSIETVYGGGNAAAVPETNVEIREAYEILNLFGGGNGKDAPAPGVENPGADVGTLDHGTSTYGTGNANSILKGGHIHEAYGGSNQKGTIKGSINQTTDPDGNTCELVMSKVVGAGKYADIDGDVNMILGCQPAGKIGLLFAGADEANVNGNITLTITNGNFGKVFGGNNLGGAIKGKIVVNVEETGCRPIRIDELYLGSNEAAYSIYGYYESGEEHPVTGKKILKPRTSANDGTSVENPAPDETHSFPYADPELNIISCTHIGQVFGGGYGVKAKMYANPTVNINMIKGTATGSLSTLGSIGDVYGGGNAASVIGNTTVNIGTKETVTMISVDDDLTTDVIENQFTVEGANITGNVYGGGKLADVGYLADDTKENDPNSVYCNTFVNICAKEVTESNTTVWRSVAEGTQGVTIAGNVYGGGKGQADASTFKCEKAMVVGNTTVRIGNGKVGTLDSNGKLVENTGNVYGGGEVGRVERSSTVTIGFETGTSQPEIRGNVFGAGSGVTTHGYSALVRGNSEVTVQGNAKVDGSVYGGGETASVGRYNIATTPELAAQHNVEVGEPYGLISGGKSTVTIQGNAEIGPDDMKMTATGGPDDAGHVFGAGRGVLPYQNTGTKGPGRYYLDNGEITWEAYGESNEEDYEKYMLTLALSDNTDVTIDGNTFVKGSVYGGSENGHVRTNTLVKIQGGQIGAGFDKSTDKSLPMYDEDDFIDPATNKVTEENALKTCAAWPYDKATTGKPYDMYEGTTGYDSKGGADAANANDGHTFYGNVFGGGSGYFPYAPGKWLESAGSVGGNTVVTITGGHILSNVYGGNEQTNVEGSCTITMSGGSIGVPRTKEQIQDHPVIGNLFGAGKGDKRVLFNTWTNVASTSVTITGGKVYGSVFGGGEDGHVRGDATTKIEQASGKSITIGSTGESTADGNVFGGGRGSEMALTAGVVGGNVSLTINSGKILGSVYGGGRLASVGTNFTAPNDDNYGKLQEPGADHGNITITINNGTIGQSTSTTGVNGNIYGGSKGTTADFRLGIARSTTINMTGGTAYSSVYGGGELAQIVGYHTTSGQNFGTEINISGGTIGNTIGNEESGNVYGGGKGNTTNTEAGLVNTNTKVSISQAENKTTTICHNVYGGGAYGSVGTYVVTPDMKNFYWTNEELDANKTTYTYNNTGVCNVTITGGTIGTGVAVSDDGIYANGNVFGAGKGLEDTWWCEKAIAYETNVTITDGTIKGTVYGGGQVGRVENNATVTIGKSEETGEESKPNITGNVFGAGAGVKTHGYSALVRGNAFVTVQGIAQVGGSVYGGGEIASVGRFTVVDGLPKHPDSGGTCNVTIQDHAKIGTSGTTHHVFGACKGVTPAYSNDPDDPNRSKSMQLATNTPADASLWSYYEPDHTYIWRYYKTEADYLDFLETLALTSHPIVTIAEDATVNGSVYGGGERGITLGSVEVNMNGGTVAQDVYGGGSLANSNKGNWDDATNTWSEGKTSASYTTTVNLLGGIIKGDAYGGGLGQKIGFNGGTSDIEATVFGDITVNLGTPPIAATNESPAVSVTATAFNVSYENTDEKEKDDQNSYIQVVKSGRVFGCNNLNGSPQGYVTVNVYKTVGLETVENVLTVNYVKPDKDKNLYELAAVYGGGNLADYTATGKKASVIVHTCDVSVQHVYGGGNAAAVPETDVLVKGAWEIEHVFGGGNGKDKYKKGNEWIVNGGANVLGNTNTLLIGGYIHEAYGGSNEKGTIGGNVTINTDADDPDCACALDLVKLYGAGKNADIEGDLIVVLDCAPETKTEEVYGGAENANVRGNVELTITSGTFGKVFGGNNQSGAIFGHIILNIEETNCRPIIIDELYGCGNNAAYSVYGYKSGTDNDGYQIYIPRTSLTDGVAKTFEDKPHTDPGANGYADPEVNIISCTHIGKVFGGGYGSGATVYGNPTVNINQIYGKAYVDNDPTKAYTATATTLGTIGDVFGGGNAANVVGNTNVNIATKAEVWLHQSVDDNGNYTMYPSDTDSGKGISVVGANITGNVYGGGNEAEVTGNTNVTIGKDGTATTTPVTP